MSPPVKLVRYDAACKALAAAKKVDEVKAIGDGARAFAAAMRIVKNRDLEADAVEIRLRAERRLGEMMTAAKKTGELKPGSGRPKKNGSPSEPFRATLAEAGIDKKLSVRAQQLNAMPESDFSKVVSNARAAVTAPKVVLSEKTVRAIAAGPMAVPPSFADVKNAWLEAGTTRERLSGFLSKLPASEINEWRAILLGIRDACDDGLDLLDRPKREGANARVLQ
jgi:hypothetical protein